MKNLSKMNVLLSIIILLLLASGVYFFINKPTYENVATDENINYTQTDDAWIKDFSQKMMGTEVLTRTVHIAEGDFEQQRIAISSSTTQLNPEEWVSTQIDLNDVLVISYEWGFSNGYRHLNVASRTVSDDARIDYFFKNNEVITFVFQPLHALKDKDTENYYLKVISDYLSN